MKKYFFTLVVVFLSTHCFSQGNSNEFDYTIVFSGKYQNDLMNLSINNKTIISNYILNNVDSLEKGHLSLTQKGNNIEIYYNSKKVKRRKVKFDKILEIDISINNKVEKISVDVRKGKVLLLTYDFNNNGLTKHKQISIEQIQEPFIL